MNLVIVAGYAGSGKSEVAKALAQHFRWPLIDKDTLTRPLLEAAAEVVCGDKHDRHTETYVEVLRPLEYECLMSTTWEVVHHNSSAVVTAPFLKEAADEEWCEELAFNAEFADLSIHWVWLHADLPTMRSRLTSRRAPRDGWKLANWDMYASTVDLDLRPVVGDYHLVVNSEGTSLPFVVEELIARLKGRIR